MRGEVCIAIEVAVLGGNCIAIHFSGQQVCIAIQIVLSLGGPVSRYNMG